MNVAVVEVAAAAMPEARVHMPDTDVVIVSDVPDVIGVNPVRQMNAMRQYAMNAMAADAGTIAVAAVWTRVSAGGDKRRNTDGRRCDKSKECRTFEHGVRPFSVGSMWAIRRLVGAAAPLVQAIDFRRVFVHLTFIDGAPAWRDGGYAGLSAFAHRRKIG